MADNHLTQSALAHLHLEARAAQQVDGAGVTLCERAPRDQIALRGKVGDAVFRKAVNEVLGVEPPADAGATATRRGITLLWLGPDEWLVVLPNGRAAKTLQTLGAALDGMHAALTDVSSSRIVIGLGGEHAREVLAKGCSLDLHPIRFTAGQCAQSSLARCHMLLHQLDDAPSYDIYIHRSFADYAWRWLEDAAGEYGVAVSSAA